MIFFSVSKVDNPVQCVCKLKVVFGLRSGLMGAEGRPMAAQARSDPGAEAINLEGTRGIYRMNKVKAAQLLQGALGSGVWEGQSLA